MIRLDEYDFSDSEDESCDHVSLHQSKSCAIKTVRPTRRTGSTVSIPSSKSSYSTYRLVDYDADSEDDDEPLFGDRVAFIALSSNAALKVMKKTYLMIRCIEAQAFEDDEYLPPKKKTCFLVESKQGLPSGNFAVSQHIVDRFQKSLNIYHGDN